MSKIDEFILDIWAQGRKEEREEERAQELHEAQLDAIRSGTLRIIAAGDARMERSGHESDRYNYPADKRREIVKHYRTERAAGRVANKDAWAQHHYMITGRTLLNYEREFPE